MGLFDRLSRVVRANLNDMIENADNPEAVLEQAIIDMQEDLIQLRQAVARAIGTQKRTEQQYNKNQSETNNWQNRSELALSKGDENLAALEEVKITVEKFVEAEEDEGNEPPSSLSSNSAVDAELDALREQIDNL